MLVNWFSKYLNKKRRKRIVGYWLSRIQEELGRTNIFGTFETEQFELSSPEHFSCDDMKVIAPIIQDMLKAGVLYEEILDSTFTGIIFWPPGRITNNRSEVHRKWGEKLLNNLKFLIPRRNREPLIGDIMEDCHELRSRGKTGLRVLVHVLWQFAIGLILLCPAAVLNSLIHKVIPPKH